MTSITPELRRTVNRPKGLNLAYNDPNNHWGQFVHKLVARHKGVVDHWVVWNEPDLFDPAIRYTWEGSYEEYFQLLKVAYLNVKEVNPAAKVVLGGLAYWWDKEYNRPPYLGPLFEVIARDPEAPRNNHYFDIASAHTYANPLNSYTQPLIMRDILEARGVKKPIWIGESNISPDDEPNNPLLPGGLRGTMDQQASYMIQSMALGLAAGVERYSVYKMTDEAPENGTEMWGLQRNDGSIKPAFLAYQVGANYFSNATSAVYTWHGSADPPTPDQVRSVLRSNENRPQFIWPSQVSQVVMERGPKLTTVVWNNSPVTTKTTIEASAKRAARVTKYGKADTITAQGGVYTIDLPGSTHNPDKRD